MMKMEKPQAPLVLDIAGLTSHYGRIQALHGIELQVRQGQLVALVGANGAGKTTLLRAISGVQPISAGSIVFAGQDVSRMSADKRVRAGICQVPEGRQVFGPMTVEDNLRLGAFTRPAQDVAGDMERMYGLFPILKEKRLLLEKIEREKIRGQVTVTRFKGLGEMNPSQLRESTIHPDTRRLVQLTVEDGATTAALMDMLLSKKRAGDRKSWLETKGDLASLEV